MRSKTPLLDVSAICGRYGGGGHQLAAGARMRGELAEVEARVLAHVHEEVVRHQLPIIKPQRQLIRIPFSMIRSPTRTRRRVAGGQSPRHDLARRGRHRPPLPQHQKVGHCGTLDPLATGLLIVVLGRGTKIQDLLMAEDKEYVGTMTLGTTTTSQDRDGEIVESWPVPPDIDRARIDAAFAKFHGDFYQMPPMVSAIKKGGVPLYKLARQGKTVEREPRFVHVFAHEIKDVRSAGRGFPRGVLEGFLCAHVCARHRRGTGLRRAPEGIAPHAVGPFRPEPRGDGGRNPHAADRRTEAAHPQPAGSLADARGVEGGEFGIGTLRPSWLRWQEWMLPFRWIG